MCNASGIFSGVQNLANAQMAEATARGNAKTIKSVAKQQSKKIVNQGRKDASSARAAAAENGLDVNVGVPAVVEDEILGDAAYNASMNISQAAYGASNVLRQGKMQRNEYGMKAVSDFVGAATSGGGWK